MAHSESQENYLETILQLSKTLSGVRAIDIVHELGFKKSSVSVAMKHLREKELISVDEDGFIHLTAEGRQSAEKVYDRHRTLTAYFSRLGVPLAIAEEDACKMEHILHPETYAAIKRQVEGDL